MHTATCNAVRCSFSLSPSSVHLSFSLESTRGEKAGTKPWGHEFETGRPAGRPTDRPIRPRNVLASNYREKVCFAPRPCSSPGCEHGMHHRRRVSPGVIELTATLENRVYSVYTLYTRTYTRIRMSFVEALTST